MPPRKQGMPGWAIALIVVGIVIVVIGVLAAIAIPSFMKYVRRAKTTEAAPNLKKIFDGARAYYEKGAVVSGPSTGADLQLQFPDPVGLTPIKPCCRQSGKKCHDTDWTSPTWAAIGFEISDPHYFQYRFSSMGRNRRARFTAGAHADLDCDGILSTWERTATVDAQRRVVGAASLFGHLPYE
jgi:type II secretory pathway pseudopilin PulG